MSLASHCLRIARRKLVLLLLLLAAILLIGRQSFSLLYGIIRVVEHITYPDFKRVNALQANWSFKRSILYSWLCLLLNVNKSAIVLEIIQHAIRISTKFCHPVRSWIKNHDKFVLDINQSFVTDNCMWPHILTLNFPLKIYNCWFKCCIHSLADMHISGLGNAPTYPMTLFYVILLIYEVGIFFSRRPISLLYKLSFKWMHIAQPWRQFNNNRWWNKLALFKFGYFRKPKKYLLSTPTYNYRYIYHHAPRSEFNTVPIITIPTPLISHYPLPFSGETNILCMAECLFVDFRQEPVNFNPPEAKFLVPDWGHRVCRTGLPTFVAWRTGSTTLCLRHSLTVSPCQELRIWSLLINCCVNGYAFC